MTSFEFDAVPCWYFEKYVPQFVIGSCSCNSNLSLTNLAMKVVTVQFVMGYEMEVWELFEGPS